MKKIYSISEVAKAVGKTTETLRNWDKKGLLVAERTITNQRYYTDEHLKQLNINPKDLNV